MSSSGIAYRYGVKWKYKIFPERKDCIKLFMDAGRRKLAVVTAAAAILFVFAAWMAWGNTSIEVTRADIVSDRLPKSFSGFKIAHVSDLHNAEFGKSNSRLLEKIEKEKPDVIVITGDLVDSRRTDIDIAIGFSEKAMKIAQVYYVTGNHEARIDDFERLESGLEDLGVVVLRDEVDRIEKDNEKILLIGLDDPKFTLKSDWFGETPAMVNAKLKNLKAGSGDFSILLSHRPELFDTYAANGIDLVLSGHTHGGQVRIPFIGAVVVPDQDIFPKYDAGLFHSGNTYMMVSKGLGNSIFPVRINCRPELVIVTLEKAERN